jgi:hypothetical protein
MDDYKWNELVYNAKFSFEPAIGETYHMYLGDDGIEFYRQLLQMNGIKNLLLNSNSIVIKNG